MATATTRRLAGAAAIPALALALAACSSDDPSSSSGSDTDDDAKAQLGAQEAVLASYEGLDGESYKMESDMTVNGIDFMDATSVVDGDASQSTQDMYMSAIMEAMGEDIPEDEEMAEMMETMFADLHTESIVVDDVLYMQFSGGIFDAMAQDFGEDAWFTLDLGAESELSEIYAQFNSFELGELTEMLVNDLADVEETADGVYTGTLSSDADSMQSMLGATGGSGAEMIDDTQVTITVEDDLLKTIEMTLPEIEDMTMNFVAEVVEIGGDYDIAAPDSDNLRSFDEFAGMMQ